MTSHHTAQCHPVTVVFVAKPGLIILLEVIHFHGCGTRRHPTSLKTNGCYLGHLYRTGITFVIHRSDRHILTLGKQVCSFLLSVRLSVSFQRFRCGK